MTAAKAIIECLNHAGISKVFCVPGESYLPVLEEIHNEDKIQLISTRHEGGAAFMAEAYAKATRKPGVVLATRAVGASNLSIGVHTAFQDSTPLVVLLGQVSRKFRGREGFQEIDLVAYFSGISKWAMEVNDPERMPEIMERALRISQSGRPGPVVISLPEDVLGVEADMSFGPVFSIPRPVPCAADIAAVRQMLLQAKKPVIIAGGGVKTAKAEAELQYFAEKYELPVLTAFRRHDVFPHQHRLYMGHLGLGTHPEIIKTVEEADLILALGTRLSEVTTQDYSIISDQKQLIHIDISYESIGKVYQPDIGIVADMKEALSSLKEMDLQPSWMKWSIARREAYLTTSNIFPLENDVLQKQIIQVLAKKLDKHALLTVDAGNFAGWLHAFYPFQGSDTFIGPTSGAMGYGLPAAIGAKLGFPDKQVVSLSGDGGFMMTAQELETAVRYDIPIICLVFNNNMYGTIRMHQEMHYPNHVIGTELGEISFKDLAISLGANGYQVDNKEDFEAVFIKSLQVDKVSLIEILTDPEQISVKKTISDLRHADIK